MGVAVVVASVVMVVARGRKDRGADSKRQSVLVVALCRDSIVALVHMRVRVLVRVRVVEARQHRLPVHGEAIWARGRRACCACMCVRVCVGV